MPQDQTPPLLSLHIIPINYATSSAKVYILTLGPLAIHGTTYYNVFDRYGKVTGYIDRGDGKSTISSVLVKHSNPKILTHDMGSVLENTKRNIPRIAESCVQRADGRSRPWFELLAKEPEAKGLVVAQRRVREAVANTEDCWLSLPEQLGEMWLESKREVSGW
ncbi:hypothetical protein BDW74DRAFT_173829 [Aspergillus multicolor]|uniref:uncharacterized protein n=1 Tax=Aspergillus multicolor TaxID=41759 RepID=UPI003CCCFF27